MTRRVFVLDSAKEEFAALKRRVKGEFGETTWNTINAEYKAAFRRIEDGPEAGNPIDLLQDLGMNQIRYVLVRQTRIVYAYDEHQVLVHMFIHTRRDFRTHLLKRLLAPGSGT